MAIWQHDLRIVPRDELQGRGFRPGEPLPDRADQESWWSGRDVPAGLEKRLGSVLPQLPPWARGWAVFGVEDGNRIDVIRNDGDVEEIKARLDARRADPSFVAHLVMITKLLDGVLLSPDLRVVEPDVFMIQEELAASPAAAFVRNNEDQEGGTAERLYRCFRSQPRPL